MTAETEHEDRAIQGAKDAAFVFVLASLIRHHPDRDAVLADLRRMHVGVPAMPDSPGYPSELNEKQKTVFLSWLAQVRETEQMLLNV